MEHQTGLGGPDGTAEAGQAEQAFAVDPGSPDSVARADDRGPMAGEMEPGPGLGLTRPAEPAAATGELRVDAALRLLERLPGLPVSEHPGLFEQVHAQLSDVLSELDSGPVSPAGG
jgi:hypothetical protein